MTTDIGYDSRYLGQETTIPSSIGAPQFSVNRIIANRIAPELRKQELSIFGFGAATDVPLVMAQTGLFDGDAIHDYPSTTEHGSYGGIVMPGWQFSANMSPSALLDGATQFDAIDGGLCKFTALSFAEYDETGVVNVSKFGKVNPGAGGFIDIAQNAERLVFAGTFTTAGLKVSVSDGKLKIENEGKVKKFVKKAESITYRAQDGVRDRGQQTIIVTERAVFRCLDTGLELIEIAPGIDLQAQVLDMMDFPPVSIADPLPLMDPKYFFNSDKNNKEQINEDR